MKTFGQQPFNSCHFPVCLEAMRELPLRPTETVMLPAIRYDSMLMCWMIFLNQLMPITFPLALVKLRIPISKNKSWIYDQPSAQKVFFKDIIYHLPQVNMKFLQRVLIRKRQIKYALLFMTSPLNYDVLECALMLRNKLQ